MLWSLFHLSFAFLDPTCYIFLHCTDLTHILETLGERMDPVETEEMMLLADEDGDGNINYEEFISMLFKVSVWKCVLIRRYFAYFRDLTAKNIRILCRKEKNVQKFKKMLRK